MTKLQAKTLEIDDVTAEKGLVDPELQISIVKVFAKGQAKLPKINAVKVISPRRDDNQSPHDEVIEINSEAGSDHHTAPHYFKPKKT